MRSGLRWIIHGELSNVNLRHRCASGRNGDSRRSRHLPKAIVRIFMKNCTVGQATECPRRSYRQGGTAPKVRRPQDHQWPPQRRTYPQIIIGIPPSDHLDCLVSQVLRSVGSTSQFATSSDIGVLFMCVGY